MDAPDIVLKPGRDKPVRHRHPWLFSGAIAQIPAALPNGAIVSVVDHRGAWLAQGYLNRTSQIQVRLLSWDQREVVDDSFWRRRLAQAISGRANLASPHAGDSACDAYRLVNGESDGLPGLIVDRYGPYLVLQAGTLGIDLRKERFAQLLMELTGCAGIVERDDLAMRSKEGLAAVTTVLVGSVPQNPVQVHEHGCRFLVDLLHGQKTGFYTDQRQNRRRVAAYCRQNRVLNGFSYTGAFAVHALRAGARHLVNIDTSMEALRLGEENLRLNGFDPDSQAESIAGDIFQILREWRDDSRGADPFDVIILDPPKFAHGKGDLEAALRGYKDINMLALQLLKPGGILATFSCSGLVSAELFQKVVFGAALDAHRTVQIYEWVRQSSDHPVAITFPEGAYLKGLICRVV